MSQRHSRCIDLRLGNDDGNPTTSGDPTWEPLQLTYPIPDHDSGHAVQGGTAAEVLKQFFGTDKIRFRACSRTLLARTCTDPSQACASTPASRKPRTTPRWPSVHDRRDSQRV
jgi:hypothetical protein